MQRSKLLRQLINAAIQSPKFLDSRHARPLQRCDDALIEHVLKLFDATLHGVRNAHGADWKRRLAGVLQTGNSGLPDATLGIEQSLGNPLGLLQTGLT